MNNENKIAILRDAIELLEEKIEFDAERRYRDVIIPREKIIPAYRENGGCTREDEMIENFKQMIAKLELEDKEKDKTIQAAKDRIIWLKVALENGYGDAENDDELLRNLTKLQYE